LYLSPLAFLKLQFFLHAGATEIAGFGISSEEDPLYMDDFITLPRAGTCANVALNGAAVAHNFADVADRGLSPSRFARIWVHTRPGSSAAEPSIVDERTFARVFGRCDWSVMLILTGSGAIHASHRSLANNARPVDLDVRVDWPRWAQVVVDHAPRARALLQAWMEEYVLNFGANVVGLDGTTDVQPVDDREPTMDADAAWSDFDEQRARRAELEDEYFRRDGFS
jgi:hypothetical protein